jgi:mono/diheme cytochrome c family protein
MLRLFDRGVEVVSWLAAALVVVLLFAGPSLIGAKKSSVGGQYKPAGQATVGGQSERGGQATTGTQTNTSTQSAGSTVFASAGCGGCHTLKAAGTTGTTGPDLDQLRPSAAAVAATVRSGSGLMPSFSGKLSDAQISAVATYVSSVAGR